MKRSVLIVEDEDLMREVLRDYFCDADYEVSEARDGLKAIELVEEYDYDIILLDIMLPELDGFSVCRRIRKTKDTPIIIITARSDEDDKLIGYELGADDYITKPFSPKVLIAKANALIKRTRGNIRGGDNEIGAAGIVINQDSHTVSIDNDYIDLTPKEYELLMYLMINKGKVLSRDTLLSKVWGYDYFGDLRTVDTHIKMLRSSIKEYRKYIVTLRGVGYKFEP